MITGHPGLGSDPQKRIGPGKGSHTSSTTTSFTFGNNPFCMRLAKGKQQVSSSSMFDLSKYLDTDYLSYLSHDEINFFDIMKWWKSHEPTFSVLSKMAHDLLTPSMSTVASKSAFYITANMIGNKRTSLTPEMLEALMCLKDWEEGHIGLQSWVDDCRRELEHFCDTPIPGVLLTIRQPAETYGYRVSQYHTHLSQYIETYSCIFNLQIYKNI